MQHPQRGIEFHTCPRRSQNALAHPHIPRRRKMVGTECRNQTGRSRRSQVHQSLLSNSMDFASCPQGHRSSKGPIPTRRQRCIHIRHCHTQRRNRFDSSASSRYLSTLRRRSSSRLDNSGPSLPTQLHRRPHLRSGSRFRKSQWSHCNQIVSRRRTTYRACTSRVGLPYTSCRNVHCHTCNLRGKT